LFGIGRYLSKLIVFTMLASSLPIILLGLVFYLKVSDTIQRKVNEGNIQIMEQTRLRVEQVLRSVDRQTEHLAESEIVEEALNVDIEPSRFQLVQSLLHSMSRVQTFELGVQDVHLIHLQKGWVLDNEGYNKLSDFDAASRIERYLAVPKTKFWISEDKGFSKYTRKQDRVINLVRKIPAYSEHPQGMLIVEIPGRELRNLLAQENTLGEVMILDESYRLLAAMNPAADFPPDMIGTMASRLRNSPQSSGMYELDLEHAKVGLAFQRSSFNDWVYLSVIPMELIRLESRNIGWIILSLCVLMLFMAVVISLKGSHRMYAPIRRLYCSLFANQDRRMRGDELHLISEGFLRMRETQMQMADQIKGHRRQLEELYALKLIQGEMKPAEIGEKFAFLGYDCGKWKRMAVLTVQIDTLKGTRYKEQDGELLLFAISNMIGELIPREHRILPVVVRSSIVTFLFGHLTPNEEFRSFVYSTAKRIQDEVYRYLSLRVSIGISRTYDGVLGAYKACREAADALKYRILFGQRTILHIDDVQANSAAKAQYPKELERSLLDAVKMADREKTETLLDQFFRELSGQYQNYSDYQIAVTRFFVNLIRILQDSGISYPDLLGCDPPLLEQLHSLSSVEEMRSWFRESVIEPITRVYEEQRQKRYRSISQEVLQLIHERYDTDLTLESCSNELHYHPSYISKVLRQELGVSFSDYLLQYRLGKAKEMLEHTDMKIAEIAETLRYHNSQNFIRSFRKFYGLTPGAYREQYMAAQTKTPLIRSP